MKTFLKRFGFLAILAIMFNVEVVGQGASAFVGPGIYAIVNDTTLISTFAPVTWFTNARVGGIAGDEIKFVYLDADSLAIEGYWNISDSLLPNDDIVMAEYTYFFISNISDVPQINFNSVDETISGVFFFCPTKYNPQPLIIGNEEAKSDIFIGDELFISDFGIQMNSPISNGLSYPVVDSIYWYVDETYCGITYDTTSSLTTECAGIYYINLYITYTNDKNGVIASYHRNIISETVTVYENITNIILPSNKEVLTIYPNPATDILNISKEVEYSVYSYSGQKILKGFGKEIDVTKLSIGTYVLKTNNGDSKFTVVR